MKVIFLDIDGVLNSERLMNRRIHEGFNYDCDDETYHNIDEIEVRRLANFCEENNIKIVLSSSWRLENLENTIEYISKHLYRHIHPIIKYIIGVTSRLYIKKENGSWDHLDRGYEIQKYIDEHPNISNYVIIDDDSDMLESQMENFLQTDFKTGLTENDYPKIKKILHIFSNNRTN